MCTFVLFGASRVQRVGAGWNLSFFRSLGRSVFGSVGGLRVCSAVLCFRPCFEAGREPDDSALLPVVGRRRSSEFVRQFSCFSALFEFGGLEVD